MKGCPPLDNSEYARLPGGRKKLAFIASYLDEHFGGGRDASGISVLDVGCGNGAISMALGQIGYSVTGTDVDRDSIEEAQRNNKCENASFCVVGPGRMELGREFDAIICSEVLEHLEEPGEMLAGIARHLKRNGILLVTVPNGYGPREVLGRFEKRLRRSRAFNRIVERIRKSMGMLTAEEKCHMYTSNPDQDHVQKFRYSGLRNLAQDSDLKIVRRANSMFLFSLFGRGKESKDTRHGWLESFDAKLADILPYFLASGWFLVMKHRGKQACGSSGQAGR